MCKYPVITALTICHTAETYRWLDKAAIINSVVVYYQHICKHILKTKLYIPSTYKHGKEAAQNSHLDKQQMNWFLSDLLVHQGILKADYKNLDYKTCIFTPKN